VYWIVTVEAALVRAGASLAVEIEAGSARWWLSKPSSNALLVLEVRGSPWCRCSTGYSRFVAPLCEWSISGAVDRAVKMVCLPAWGAAIDGGCGGCELWHKVCETWKRGGFRGSVYCACFEDSVCSFCVGTVKDSLLGAVGCVSPMGTEWEVTLKRDCDS
jgi:hypothetical protein